MKFIIVKVSPNRWVIAEGDDGEYTVCTKRLTYGVALEALSELRELDTRDYSNFTKRILIEE